MLILYGLFEGETLVDQGTAMELVKKYQLFDRTYIYCCARRGTKLQGRYEVRKIGTLSEAKSKKVIEDLEPRDSIERYISRLKLYGNTVMSARDMCRADKVLQELADRGYRCKLIKYNTVITEDISLFRSNEPKRNRRDIDYILELL